MNASTCENRLAAGVNEQAATEYAHLIAFAREQSALLERLRRTGSRPPMPVEWRSSDAYLRDLRATVEAAEREKADRVARAWSSARRALRRLLPIPRLEDGARPAR